MRALQIILVVMAVAAGVGACNTTRKTSPSEDWQEIMRSTLSKEKEASRHS
jgi:hypothetical protein